MSLDFFDLTFNFQSLYNLWYGDQEQDILKKEEVKQPSGHRAYRRRQQVLSHTSFEVRSAVCIAGFDWSSLQKVKQTVSKVLPRSSKIALESFHIKQRGDLADGELLVPKVLVVAGHQVGRLLIDDEGDTGQLDYLYDELCDIGADVLLVYMGLPRAIYPALKHMVYHPRLIDLVFPQQTIVRQLAEDNCLVTLVEGCDFTSMQKNVIKEWLQRPVDRAHPVYKHAQQLTDALTAQLDTDVSFWSEAEIYSAPDPYLDEPTVGYHTATEEHPLAERRRKKTSRLARFKAKLAKTTHAHKGGYMALPGDDVDNDLEMGDVEHKRINSNAGYGEYDSIFT